MGERKAIKKFEKKGIVITTATKGRKGIVITTGTKGSRDEVILNIKKSIVEANQ